MNLMVQVVGITLVEVAVGIAVVIVVIAVVADGVAVSNGVGTVLDGMAMLGVDEGGTVVLV